MLMGKPACRIYQEGFIGVTYDGCRALMCVTLIELSTGNKLHLTQAELREVAHGPKVIRDAARVAKRR